MYILNINLKFDVDAKQSEKDMMTKMLSNKVRGLKSFNTSFVRFKSYMKTTLNTIDPEITIPTNFNAKSLLLLSTPSCLPRVIKEAIKLYDNNIQVMVAGVDTVSPNSIRNGISELWLDGHFDVNNAITLKEVEDASEPDRQPDGVNIVTVKGRSWKKIDSKCNIQFNGNSNFSVPLANTLFNLNSIVTMFYLQPKFLPNQETSDTILSDLSISLPKDTINETLIKTYDKWTPLFDVNNHEPLYITKSVGNLLKQINNKSAAKFLETNQELMQLASKDTEVYVKIYPKDTNVPYRYQVIAGGGGWGAKADTIALSPNAKFKAGDRIEFYMLTPADKFSNRSLIHEVDGKIILECSMKEDCYNENIVDVPNSVEHMFGGGSEEGFVYNDIQYISGGETVALTL